MNRTAFSIATQPETLAVSQKESVTGVVFVRLGDVAFPDDRWSDFPVVVMTWWCEVVQQLVEQSSATARCVFMDGPFAFEIHKSQDRDWLVTLIERRREPKIVAQAATSPLGIVDALLAGSALILDACSANGWHSHEIDGLRGARGRLAKSIESRRKRPM